MFKKKLRRKKLIDKKFQLKTTFKIIIVTMISFFAIISLISLKAFDFKKNIDQIVSHIDKNANNLNSAIQTEDNIVSAFVKFAQTVSGKGFILKTDQISEDHKKSISIMKKYNRKEIIYAKNLKSSVDDTFIILTVIIAIVILQAIFLYFYLIKLTHRISGPIFVFTRHVQDIIDGKEPQFRKLRDNDEFKEFYDKFMEMTEKIQKDNPIIEQKSESIEKNE